MHIRSRSNLVNRRSTSSVRIVVVDDHEIVRQGLTALLEREEGWSVVGSAATGEEALLAVRRLRPDVIIMDLMLPKLNGIDATRQILAELPRTAIVALSACHTSAQVYRALQAGARGYVVKTAAGVELLNAVKAVSSGNVYFSSEFTAMFVDGVLSRSAASSPIERLSIREREVLHGIVAGSTSSDIGLHLSLSRKTIDTYRGRIMVKLGVANRAALIRFALENALPGT